MSAPTPPAPAPGPGPGPLLRPRPGYEFDKDENEVINRLARSQRSVGQTLVVLGIIALGVGLAFGYVFFTRPYTEPVTEETRSEQRVYRLRYQFAPAALLTVSGLVLLPLGYWNLRSAHAFRRIVATTGQDIPQLMLALAALGRVYRLTFGLIIAPATIAVVLLAVYTYDLFKQP